MGENHACFVLSDSSLRCQGLGTSGQLGVDRAGFGDALGDAPGEVGATQPPVLLPPGVGVELLAVGGRHTCVVGTDGALRCWGANDRGQLGLGHTLPVGLDTTTLGEHLEAVTLPAHVGLAQIEAWGDTTCARTADGLLYCWGANSFGQLGQDHALDVGAAPGQPGDLAPIHTGGRAAVDVAVGGEFVCALFVDGGVRCWGKNGVGQLGQGSTASRGDSPGEMAALAPTLLGGGTVVDLDAGGVHACAVFSDGRVKCWGHNSDGQLGQGLTGPRGDGPGEMGVALPVVNLGAGRIAREISAGATNSCAIFQDRTWKCWGSNAGGGNANNQVLGAWGDNLLEMGDNLPVRALPGGALPASVDMGYQGGCAITACGAVHCWGVNTSGQAGVGSVDVVRTFPAAQALPAGLAGFEADVCP
jgi:alpha-tubulin suppressor-like RCC1 family protein